MVMTIQKDLQDGSIPYIKLGHHPISVLYISVLTVSLIMDMKVRLYSTQNCVKQLVENVCCSSSLSWNRMENSTGYLGSRKMPRDIFQEFGMRFKISCIAIHHPAGKLWKILLVSKGHRKILYGALSRIKRNSSG